LHRQVFGMPKEASLIFRTMRGGNQHFRDGDTLELEHVCRNTEAAERVIDQQSPIQQYRGSFCGGRGYDNFRVDDCDLRGRQYNTSYSERC
jgi:hypothetical protein